MHLCFFFYYYYSKLGMKVETEFTHIWVLAFLIIRSHTSFRLVVEGQRGIALKAVTRHMQQSNSSNIHAL